MPSTNRILREIVDVQCHGGRGGLAVRQRFEQLCSGRLTHALDDLLDSWAVPENQLVSLERLEVNVPGLSSANLETELVPRIVAALKTELETRLGRPGHLKPAVTRTVRRSSFAELVFFLEHGYLPWSTNGDVRWQAAIADALAQLNAVEFLVLRRALCHPEARQRLVRHFPQPTLASILPALEDSAAWREIIEDVRTLLGHSAHGTEWPRVRERLLRILLEAAVAKNVVDLNATCRRLVEEILNVAPLPLPQMVNLRSALVRQAVEANAVPRRASTASSVEQNPDAATTAPLASRSDPSPEPTQTEKRAEDRPSSRDPDTIYIRNAGLVILAPYLPGFFRTLGIASAQQLLDPATALVLQHFLVFGSEENAEWDLVLNKIFCGLPLRYAMETPAPLSSEQKEEAERLLRSVIANWPALKNTSPDGLRATFLQREGALSRAGDNWRLLLSRTSFDVLLDRLPWGFSMIRLPWMPWLLQTDWAS